MTAIPEGAWPEVLTFAELACRVVILRTVAGLEKRVEVACDGQRNRPLLSLSPTDIRELTALLNELAGDAEQGESPDPACEG